MKTEIVQGTVKSLLVDNGSKPERVGLAIYTPEGRCLLVVRDEGGSYAGYGDLLQFEGKAVVASGYWFWNRLFIQEITEASPE
jgi:hypothetical protein